MTLEEDLRQDFANDTAYERLVLSTIVDPGKAPPGTVFATNDIRGNGPRSFGRGVHESLGAGAVEAFAARFRALAFGAAYKIIDFIVEMTMRLNNEPCPKGRWTFAQKGAFTGRGVPSQLPTPLDSVPGLWDRIARLYASFDEHRHAVVHRRIKVEPNGDLTGTDRKGTSLALISVQEQDAFSRSASDLAVAIIEATDSSRQLNTIQWSLDALTKHHGCGDFGASPPPAVIVTIIDDMLPLGAGRWQVDGQKLHAHLREQNVRQIDADAELHAINGEEVLYMAYLNEVPDAMIEVDAASLPSWLHRL